MRRLSVLLALLMLVAWPGCVRAQEPPPSGETELAAKIRIANAACFACHSEAGLANPPRQGLDLAKLRKQVLNPTAFHASNHGAMECRTCHGSGVVAYPHAPGAGAEVSPCSECHASKVMRIESQFDASVHARKAKDKFTCLSCHDPHLFTVAARSEAIRRTVAQDNAMCLNCHGSDLKLAALLPERKVWPEVMSAHAWLPNLQRHLKDVRCVECHTPAAKGLSHEILAKERAERNCVTCHSADSSLRTRLYRHLIKNEQDQYGFVNSVILSNSYIIGATRNVWVDWAAMGLAMLTLGSVLLHGLARVVAWWWRGRRK